ncbi:MAG: hypothetical protein FWC70_10845 [Defluviitaleaceae bacterium]|nr:hypothetical protein [Defluviitaleaceae bacterium]
MEFLTMQTAQIGLRFLIGSETATIADIDRRQGIIFVRYENKNTEPQKRASQITKKKLESENYEIIR